MWNISFIIMWPLHNQAYCNISMKNGSNVIISKYSQSNADIKHIWDKIKHQVKSHTNSKLISQHLIFNTILKWHKSHIYQMKVKHLTWYWNSDCTTIQVTYKQMFRKFQHLIKMWDNQNSKILKSGTIRNTPLFIPILSQYC